MPAAGGARTPYIIPVNALVSDGFATIEFVAGVQNPMISAIEVLAMPSVLDAAMLQTPNVSTVAVPLQAPVSTRATPPLATPMTADGAAQRAAPVAPQVGQITKLRLIQAGTLAGLPFPAFDPLLTGAVVNLSTLTTQTLAIEAITSGPVGSIRFGYNGTPNFRTESAPKWAICGNTVDLFKPCPQLIAGAHTITATPYSGTGATGVAGTAVTVTFTITQSAAPVATPKSAPVTVPVLAPVVAPVKVPVVAPVAAPLVAPVAAPLVAPVKAPVLINCGGKLKLELARVVLYAE